jgi:hypothetical protein
VHRRVVVDLVDAVAVAVVRLQHGDVALRALGVARSSASAEATTAPKSRTRLVNAHSPPLAHERLAQRRVGLELIMEL